MNTSFSPFNIIATPASGTLTIGREVPLVGFKRLSSTFATASQMDVGSINLVYTSVDGGSSADLVFKASSPERSGSKSTEVLRVSSTGSTNDPRLGIGDFSKSDIESTLHIKGNTRVDGGRLILSADSENDVTITKRDLEFLLDGKPVDQTSTTKRGISRTNTTNAIVSLADDDTLIKINQSGILDFEVSGSTALKLEKTGKAPKVMITGSTEVSGSFTVNDLLTVLADYGQTGSFSVSGSTTLNGDVNLDGQVNVNDLLEVLAGFNASGSNTITGSMEITGSRFSRRSRSQQNATGSAALRVGGGFIAMGNPPPPDGNGESFDWPYNPDANGNGFIEVNDVLALLAIYGQDFEVAFEVSENGLLCDGDTHISGNLFHGYCEPCDEDGHNTITGIFNHAHGYNNTITGDFSFARGKDNTVTGNYGFLMGQNLTTTTEYQTVLGKQNATNDNALFIIGKGSSTNALEVESSISKFTTNLTVEGDTIKFTSLPHTDSIRTPLVIDSNGKIYTGSEYEPLGGGGGSGTFSGLSASADTGDQFNLPAGAVLTIAGGNNIETSNPAGTQIEINLTGGILSGSDQIASNISGAIDAATSSLATDITSNTDNITNLQSSASAGIRFEDTDTGFSVALLGTASFVAAGGDGLTVDVSSDNITYTLAGVLSSSQQIATDISGAIVAATSSLLNDYGLISSSTQLTLEDDDWYIFTNALTSSRDVQITASLSVGTSAAAGQYAFTQGLGSQATGNYSHAHGEKVRASGTNSYAQGRAVKADGNDSHAEGDNVRAVGSASHAEGNATIASGSYSHAEGKQNMSSGSFSHAEGYLTTASADGSHTEGYLTIVEPTALYGHAEGHNSIARGQASHAEGKDTLALGALSHAEGRETSASGDYSHAQGHRTETVGNYSFAAGIDTIASGGYSFAIGRGTHAKGEYSFAHGSSVSSSGTYSFALGSTTKADGNYSFTHGRNTLASGQWAHAEGRNTTASGNYSHAAGTGSVASGLGSYAGGLGNTASADYAFAIGKNNIVDYENGFAAGRNNKIYGAIDSFVVGIRNEVSGSAGENDYAFIVGSDNSISGNGSKGSIILGGTNTVSTNSPSSFVIGTFNKIKGQTGGFTGGQYNLLLQGNTHNFFHGRQNTGSNASENHVEGKFNYVSGSASDNEVVLGAHAEGYSNVIHNYYEPGYGSGKYSHAEGTGVNVYGDFSHAEGERTTTYGSASHAEGKATIALGNHSHAQGQGSIASGSYSFAAGIETISAGTGSATFGKYNVADTNSGSLLIIGNGGDDDNRRNLAAFNSQSIILDTAALPTFDPNNEGQLWRDGTTLKISLG